MTRQDSLHLVEIGCVDRASLHHMLTPGGRLEIFEPNPAHLEQVRATYAGCPNVTVHPYAVWKEDGVVRLHLAGHSSYVDGLPSPHLKNDCGDAPGAAVEVVARRFGPFDDGTIDVIDIDVEGAEWYVIRELRSRPRAIFVEMGWKNYVNPHYGEIRRWMADHHYYKADDCGASHCYMRLA